MCELFKSIRQIEVTLYNSLIVKVVSSSGLLVSILRIRNAVLVKLWFYHCGILTSYLRLEMAGNQYVFYKFQLFVFIFPALYSRIFSPMGSREKVAQGALKNM